jgi:small subunit ribosomal protein S2
MRTITLEELLEAGCHFGHQVTRHNPKSRDFVFEARDNIHIIDLEKTKEGLEKAAAFIKSVAERPESTMLILGTKRQAEAIVKEEAKRALDESGAGIYSVTSRWIGGTMTNFSEVAKNYKKLKDLAIKLRSEEEKAKYTKKEISLWEKERQKLLSFYDGTQDMTKIPDVVFVIDTHLEALAIFEALAMKVPTVGIVDTNADPDPITYPIPANDDAAGSIKLIASYIRDAWIVGKKKSAKKEDNEAETVNEVTNSI